MYERQAKHTIVGAVQRRVQQLPRTLLLGGCLCPHLLCLVLEQLLAEQF